MQEQGNWGIGAYGVVIKGKEKGKAPNFLTGQSFRNRPLIPFRWNLTLYSSGDSDASASSRCQPVSQLGRHNFRQHCAPTG